MGDPWAFGNFVPGTGALLPRQTWGMRMTKTSLEKKLILVVEDEASLRRLLCHALRKHGYNVLEAEIPQEALKVWKTNRAEISLVITDIVMPGGQTGWELAKIFLCDRPELKVLFMSGYFGDLPKELNVTDSNFIRKPFLPKELLVRVEALLDRK